MGYQFTLENAIENVDAATLSQHRMRDFAKELRMLVLAGRAASCRKCGGTGWSWKNTPKLEDVGEREVCERCRVWRKLSGLSQIEADKEELVAELRTTIATHLGERVDSPVVENIIALTEDYLKKVI